MFFQNDIVGTDFSITKKLYNEKNLVKNIGLVLLDGTIDMKIDDYFQGIGRIRNNSEKLIIVCMKNNSRKINKPK